MIIVTGVSRGFGKAIAELYLSKGEKVIGIGRSAAIEHTNFSFVSCDLSDLDAVRNLDFDPIVIGTEPLTLINNAGVIGEISRLSDQEASDVDHVMTVNVSAPVILTHKLYQLVENKDLFTLVNISSGAASRGIPSWASYCASKAALNMLTQTFFLEEQEKGNCPKVFAVAPGVIDTDMQSQIRSTNPENFSSLEKFEILKDDGSLFTPEEASARLYSLIHFPFTGEIFFDLREIPAK